MKILLAEDDLRLGRAVRRVFEEEGYETIVASDGAQALKAATEDAFDVMVLDIMLPELDGFALCRRLRLDGVQTPVLMMTARVDVEDRVRGLDSGADDYMLKPFAVAELLARVRALTRRSPSLNGRNGDELRAGDLALNVARHSAVRGGRAGYCDPSCLMRSETGGGERCRPCRRCPAAPAWACWSSSPAARSCASSGR